MEKKNILFLQSGPAMPDLTGKIKSKYHYFSRYFTGLIISPVADAHYLYFKTIGQFDFSPFLYYSGNAFIRNIKYILKVFSIVFNYKKRKKIDIYCFNKPIVVWNNCYNFKKANGSQSYYRG